jgi:hypothetical protein
MVQKQSIHNDWAYESIKQAHYNLILQSFWFSVWTAACFAWNLHKRVKRFAWAAFSWNHSKCDACYICVLWRCLKRIWRIEKAKEGEISWSNHKKYLIR